MYRWLLISISVVVALLFTNWQSITTSTEQVRSPVLRVPQDFPTIQAAVDKATEGSTILIESGVYTENITITQSLILRGSGLNETFLQARAGFKDTDGFNPIISVLSRDIKSINLQVANLTLQSDANQDLNKIKNVGVKIVNSQKTSVTLSQLSSLQLWSTLVAPSLENLLIEYSTFENNWAVFHCDRDSCALKAENATVAHSRFVKNQASAIEIEGKNVKIHDNVLIGNLERYEIDESYSAITLLPTENGRAEAIGNTVSFYVYAISLGIPLGLNVGRNSEVIIKRNYLSTNSSGIAISTPYGYDRTKELPSLNTIIEENVIVNGGIGIDLDHRSNSGGGKIQILKNYIAGMKRNPLTTSPTVDFGEYPLYGKGIHIRAVRSDTRPVVQWTVEMIGNKIIENETWGVAVNQVPGWPEGECLIEAKELLPPGFIRGQENYIYDNGKGSLCSEDYPWPPGFMR